MASQNVLSVFKAIILVQLFYAMSILIITYSIPSEQLNHVESFGEITGDINAEEVRDTIEGGVTSQANVPLIELGALIFYSGNILLDLILNFVFALPQMLGLLIYGLSSLISIDTYIIYQVQIFLSAAVLGMYFISIMQLLTGLRTGRAIQ